MRNRQVLLVSRPPAAVVPENFRIVESEMPAPGKGEVLVRMRVRRARRSRIIAAH